MPHFPRATKKHASEVATDLPDAPLPAKRRVVGLKRSAGTRRSQHRSQNSRRLACTPGALLCYPKLAGSGAEQLGEPHVNNLLHLRERFPPARWVLPSFSLGKFPTSVLKLIIFHGGTSSPF